MCWENAAAKRAWFDSTAIALGKLPTLTEYAIHVSCLTAEVQFKAFRVKCWVAWPNNAEAQKET
jgi:hypothetical protein